MTKDFLRQAILPRLPQFVDIATSLLASYLIRPPEPPADIRPELTRAKLAVLDKYTRRTPSAEQDTWGSRCRGDDGRFIARGECPDPLEDCPEIEASPLTFAIGSNGVTRYDFRFQVVDARDLIASHDPFTFEPNPRYPQELQPRLRDRAATRIQVDRIAQNLEPDSLLTDFRVLDRGAPIIGPDMVVESGNGRVMALQKASEDFPDNYGSYVDMLAEVAPTFGIPESDVDSVDNPVLVRVRLSKVDRKAFAEEANTPSTLATSAIEQARSDAGRITAGMLNLLAVGENQSIEDALRAAANRSFVSSFLSTLPETEQARLVDSDGRINQDGIRRMVLGIFLSVFQDGLVGLQLAEMAFESIDLQVRNIINGIGRALGPLAQGEALTKSGDRDGGLSVGQDLGAAVGVFRKVKATPGMTVEKYLNQAQLFERELTDFQEQILNDIDARSRSAKAIGGILRNYAQLVIDSPPPGQGALLAGAGPVKEELWNVAVNRPERNKRKGADTLSRCLRMPL